MRTLVSVIGRQSVSQSVGDDVLCLLKHVTYTYAGSWTIRRQHAGWSDAIRPSGRAAGRSPVTPAPRTVRPSGWQWAVGRGQWTWPVAAAASPAQRPD